MSNTCFNSTNCLHFFHVNRSLTLTLTMFFNDLLKPIIRNKHNNKSIINYQQFYYLFCFFMFSRRLWNWIKYLLSDFFLNKRFLRLKIFHFTLSFSLSISRLFPLFFLSLSAPLSRKLELKSLHYFHLRLRKDLKGDNSFIGHKG